MLSHLRLSPVFLAACALAAVSCGPSGDSPDVMFGSSDVVGRWQDPALDAGADAATAEPSAAVRTGSVVPSSSNSTAGRASPVPSSTDAGSGHKPESAGASGSSAAESGSTPAPPLASTVTSVSFQVTTTAAGGRYQPKNIGAIWIEDSSGKVVKSLEVWAATRRRYLTGYLGAMAGSTIDVKTSATLQRHQTHSITWDLKDRNGATVAPGAYRLRMELTDADRTGKANTVAFDTSKGPSSAAVADAPSFGAMKLEMR